VEDTSTIAGSALRHTVHHAALRAGSGPKGGRQQNPHHLELPAQVERSSRSVSTRLHFCQVNATPPNTPAPAAAAGGETRALLEGMALAVRPPCAQLASAHAQGKPFDVCFPLAPTRRSTYVFTHVRRQLAAACCKGRLSRTHLRRMRVPTSTTQHCVVHRARPRRQRPSSHHDVCTRKSFRERWRRGECQGWTRRFSNKLKAIAPSQSPPEKSSRLPRADAEMASVRSDGWGEIGCTFSSVSCMPLVLSSLSSACWHVSRCRGLPHEAHRRAPGRRIH
jgi:hypothetical protein